MSSLQQFVICRNKSQPQLINMEVQVQPKTETIDQHPIPRNLKCGIQNILVHNLVLPNICLSLQLHVFTFWFALCECSVICQIAYEKLQAMRSGFKPTTPAYVQTGQTKIYITFSLMQTIHIIFDMFTILCTTFVVCVSYASFFFKWIQCTSVKGSLTKLSMMRTKRLPPFI
jgi:hypothetical protein